MDKKKLVILIAAVLALVLVVVLIKTGLNQDKPEETLPSDSAGETVQATNDEPTIVVEETEPSLGGGGEIDFDDLIEAANAG